MKKLALALLALALLTEGNAVHAKGRFTTPHTLKGRFGPVPADLGWCHGPCSSAVQR